MPIDFPSSPTVGQQYVYAGISYTYTAQGVWAASSSLAVLGKSPTTQVFLSGSGTYTTPANCVWIEVEMCGGGAGGANAAGGGAWGAAGVASTFGSLTAGGAGANTSYAGAGIPGIATGGDVNIQGGGGTSGSDLASGAPSVSGGHGGTNLFGGAGSGVSGANGVNASPNTGAGGGGTGTTVANTQGGTGGSAGGYLRKIIVPPAATYSYAIGGGGAGGTGAGNGGSGIIIVKEYYGPLGATSPALSPTISSNFSVGYTFTSFNIGTISSGTLTPAPASGNYQYYINGGAHTFAAPTVDCAIEVMVTNSATAGAITFTGFTVGSNTGDAMATTNASRFIISIRRINTVATYMIKALQ